MNISPSTLTIQQPLFYFDDVRQLADFESFEVHPCIGNHDSPAPTGDGAEWWSVTGKLQADKVVNPDKDVFPVADLHTEQYARLFARMCSAASLAYRLARAEPDNATTALSEP